MYAIRAGKEYIKNADFGTVALSAVARTFKTRAAAEAECPNVLAKIDQYIANYTKYRDDEVKKLAQAQKNIAAREAKLKELYLLPFGEVEAKVKKVRGEIDRASFYVTNNSIRSYNQSLTRLVRIRANEPKVIEIIEKG